MSSDRNTRLPGRPHDHKVGYGKPPAAHRFKKGRSGNPGGRPKGAKSSEPALSGERLKAIVLEEAYRPVTVGEGDRKVTLPIAQAVIRRLTLQAAQGEPRAQRPFIEMLTVAERESQAEYEAFVKMAIDYKSVWEDELERRKKHGITDAPAPLPHPDHIEINPQAGAVRIVGPLTKEEKVVHDLWIAQKQELVAKLEKLQKRLKAAQKYAVKKKLRNEIDLTMARLRENIENPPKQIGIGGTVVAVPATTPNTEIRPPTTKAVMWLLAQRFPKEWEQPQQEQGEAHDGEPRVVYYLPDNGRMRKMPGVEIVQLPEEKRNGQRGSKEMNDE